MLTCALSVRCNGLEISKVLKEIIRDDFRLAVANAHLSSSVASHLGIKKTEIISILKRRHNSMENVGVGIAGGDLKLHNISSMNGAGSSSINSTTLSDSSLQKFDDDDDESDSDWDGFPVSDKNQKHVAIRCFVFSVHCTYGLWYMGIPLGHFHLFSFYSVRP